MNHVLGIDVCVRSRDETVDLSEKVNNFSDDWELTVSKIK